MITANGVGSGLDIEGLVTQLVAAERSPVQNRLNRQEIQLKAKISAFGALKGSLSTFQAALSSLTDAQRFMARKVTLSQPGMLTATAGTRATAGSYDVEVSQLAKSHSLASGLYASTADVLGTGTLTFRLGTTDYDPLTDAYNGFTANSGAAMATVTIDSSNNTVAGVRDAINAASIGVKASIVNDGSGYRLLLTSGATGAQNSLQVSVADGDGNHTDAAGLSTLAFNSAATQMTQTVVARDAALTINGLAVTSGSNTVSNAIDDVVLNLTALTSGSPVSISVAQDNATVKAEVVAFVAAYNSFMETVNSQTAYNAATQVGGALLGDATLRTITRQIREMVGNAVPGLNGALTSFAAIGIVTESDGKLTLNNARFDSALASDFDGVAALFAAKGRATDSQLSYLRASANTVAGSHAVTVDQLASRGLLAGAGVLPDFLAGGTVVIDGDNDTLGIRINGVLSGTITLTQGTYTSGQSLAAEIQARINGDSVFLGGGIEATVSYDSAGNRLLIESTRYGSDSTVSIVEVDTNSGATLGLTVASGSAGLDAAGTIGGLVATGRGQTLAGASGSAVAGLEIQVSGGAIGARGSVEFSRGVASRLDLLLGNLLGSQNILDDRTDGLETRIERIGQQREVLDRRMAALEARYRSQFATLDSLLSQLQTTSGYLTQQLASLPGAYSGDKQ